MTGIGFALVSAPFLTLALGGGDGVRLSNLFGIAVNVLMLASGDWRFVSWRVLPALAVPGILVVPIAAWLISGRDGRTLLVVTAILVLIAVAALGAGLRLRSLGGPPGGLIAGAISGAMNAIGGVAGPLVAIYAANADWSPEVQRGTLAAYFMSVNLAAVLARGVPALPSVIFVVGILVLALGFGVGVVAARFIDHRTVRAATLTLASAGAFAAIFVAIR